MTLKVGVVGAGGIAVESHLPVLRSLKNVQVVAICDSRMDIAKEAASKFGIKNVFDDLESMLSKEEPDVVDICTPPFTHLSLSVETMNNGCHVLVEKPMAASVQEADTMLLASKKNNVRLCVVHQNLYNPAVTKAKELVKSGALGDILHIELRTFESRESELCTNKDHWCHKLPGGIFYEIIPHPVYLSQYFLEDVKPVHVLGRKLGRSEWMKNDELRVLLEGRNGLGNVLASCNSYIHGDTIDILGSKMALRADLWGRTVITFKPHTRSALSVGMSNLALSSQFLKVLGTTASTFFKASRGKASAHYMFISRFIQSLTENTEPPTTAEQGREAVVLLESICGQLK
jgi:predicted dehydrogenase